MKVLTEKQQRVKSLKDFALSMLSGIQNYQDNDIDIEELYDWLEIDAQHILKRVDKFRELESFKEEGL